MSQYFIVAFSVIFLLALFRAIVYIIEKLGDLKERKNKDFGD